MTTETILTDEQIEGTIEDIAWPNEEVMKFAVEVARAIEQDVLQSEQVRAWKRDAERLEFMEKDSGQTIFRRGSDWYTSPQRYPGAATPRAVRHKTMRDAIDAAMEKQK